jgi:uncharacterized MAPEG superfamily protein
MSIELHLLGAAVVLGLVHLFWAAGAARAQQGYAWAGGPRDEPRPVTGRAARLDRAFRNYRETFPLFAAAVLAAEAADRTGTLTAVGAGLYVAARAAFLPLYAFHLGLARSLAWFVGMAGLFAVVLGFFIP